MDAEQVGVASMLLGAGRRRAEDSVDHAVGVVLHAKPGMRVEQGQPLVDIHHRDGRGVEAALALCRDAVTIGDEPPPSRPVILDNVR